MRGALDFDGMVAIVTGGGRGIGRDTALGLARRGARVLVNDYGGDRTGIAAGTIEVADAVVEEIRAEGGTATADGSTIGSGASATAVVQNAMESFGRVDILVNCAGGAIGGPLDAQTDEEIEAQIRTLLMGPFMLMRRVWPVMREQRFGRIVHILSGALLGGELCAPYSAAKAGLIGLTNSGAFEGAASGISVNGVWPLAYTRLISERPNPDEAEALVAVTQNFAPHLVAEAIVYLCAAECPLNGEMFDVGGGRVARLGIFGAAGYRSGELTAEDLAVYIEQARDMSDAVLLASAEDELALFRTDDGTSISC